MLKFLPKSLVGAVVVVLVGATAALALPPFSTAPKTASPRGDAAELYGSAAGCHATFDRFVINARFATPGYDVRYVPRIIADPSGRPVSLLGATRIRIRLSLAAGHDNHGTNLLASTLTPRCPNLLQVKKAGDFEGVVTFGLGLSRTTGFRVFRLTNPTRVVIDVAH
ncbi:MAG TPA: hypothetical protein VFH80_23970 [Solirubrobacteraceae bacterium]|nr:hypothetical protein [Solirubrobacteraceae bacterium]